MTIAKFNIEDKCSIYSFPIFHIGGYNCLQEWYADHSVPVNIVCDDVLCLL